MSTGSGFRGRGGLRGRSAAALDTLSFCRRATTKRVEPSLAWPQTQGSCVKGPTGRPPTHSLRRTGRATTIRQEGHGRGRGSWPAAVPLVGRSARLDTLSFCRRATTSGWNRRSTGPRRRVRACKGRPGRPPTHSLRPTGRATAIRQEGQGADGACRMSEPGRQGAPVVWQDSPQDGRMGGERATIARAVGEHDPDADRRGVANPARRRSVRRAERSDRSAPAAR